MWERALNPATSQQRVRTYRLVICAKARTMHVVCAWPNAGWVPSCVLRGLTKMPPLIHRESWGLQPWGEHQASGLLLTVVLVNYFDFSRSLEPFATCDTMSLSNSRGVC